MTYPALWTQKDLDTWRLSLPPDLTPRRRELYENYRRWQKPTYAERRSALRNNVAGTCVAPLKECRAPSGRLEPVEGWLTQYGIDTLRQMISRYRQEHTAWIAAERAALREAGAP